MINPCKIILADDDREDKGIIEDAMQYIDAPGVISFVNNGEQVLSRLDEFITTGNRPVLIVLDLNMPKMNGTETLRVLKSDTRFNAIPVIIYSTSVNPLEMDKCMTLGAHSYITKPISYDECVDTARIFYSFCTAG